MCAASAGVAAKPRLIKGVALELVNGDFQDSVRYTEAGMESDYDLTLRSSLTKNLQRCDRKIFKR